jgi:acetyltransferase-like isoleucine patch superfamily enzyme
MDENVVGSTVGSRFDPLRSEISSLHLHLDNRMRDEFQRSLPLNELLGDRWQRASRLGFGDSSSIYDSVLVFGNVSVGKKCWIGPYCILDGSGGLTIGDGCTVSAGSHIYTHDNVLATLSGGSTPIVRKPTAIGKHVYIGPHCTISRGISIGDYSVIGTHSYVNQDVPPYTIVAGQPAREIGEVKMEDTVPVLLYWSHKG